MIFHSDHPSTAIALPDGEGFNALPISLCMETTFRWTHIFEPITGIRTIQIPLPEEKEQ